MKKLFIASVLLGGMISAIADSPVTQAAYNFIKVINKTHSDIAIQSLDGGGYQNVVLPFSTAILNDKNLLPNGDEVSITAIGPGCHSAELAEAVINVHSNPVFSNINVDNSNCNAYIAFESATNTITISEASRTRK